MRNRRSFRRSVAVVLATALSATMLAFVAPATPASADLGQFLWMTEDGTESGSYGPNAVVSISIGAIAFQCDTFFPAADIYVVEGVPGGGATLSDVSGGKNTAIGSWGGGIFDEVIAITQPSGNLGEGTYSVVYDECQDGVFDADIDAVFEDVITVTMPDGELPPADPAIAGMKADAQLRANQYRDAGYGLWVMNALLNQAAKTLCKSGNVVACLYKHYLKGTKGVITAARDAAGDARSHYQGIADDPPDPNFDEVAPPILPPLPDDLTTDDALDVATLDAARLMAADAGLSGALLHAVERYQGADAADDPNAALQQARAAQDLAGALVDTLPDQAVAFDTVADLIASSPADIDTAAAEIEAAAQQAQLGTLPPDELASLRNLGLDDAEIDQTIADIAAADLTGWSRQRLVDELRAQADAAQASVGVFTTFQNDMSAIEDVLLLHPAVGDAGPTADAGGPYTGTAGATIDLAATAPDPGAGSPTFAWDLDGDGQFDDATGATPTVPTPPGDGIVTVLVTDSAGNTDYDIAEVRVNLPGNAPVLTLVSPATPDAEVEVGDSAGFEVSVTDADGPAPEVQWTLNGTPVGTGTTYTFGPAVTGDIGQHDLFATVVDGPHTRQISILLHVIEADADGDGYRANADCDDANALVNPGRPEIEGNGIDDDCDAATSDAVVNDAPIARNVFAGTLEDTPVTITLPATDPEGDPITFEIVSPPATGSLGPVTGNQVTFTPVLDQTGTITFTFQATDGELTSDVRTVTVDITPVADLPVAADVATSTDEDTAVEITLNGIDPDSATLTYSIVTPPAVGSLGAITGDKVTYTPAADANGPVTFTYDVTAGGDTSPPATVQVQVLPINDAPTSGPLALVTDEDTPVSDTLPAADVDGDDLTYKVGTPPSKGSVSIAADGTVTYTPKPQFSGADSFTWLAFDGALPSDEATVDVTVNEVDDLPTIADVSVSTPEDVPTTVRMEGGDLDDPPTFTIVTPPTNGTLGAVSGRRVVYTPGAEYSGPDSFTYQIEGGGVTEGPATASITVTTVNDPPVAVDEATATQNGTPATIDVLANDTDIDGGPLSVLTLGLPSTGSATLGAGGEVTYVAPVGFSGVAHVPYTITDGAGGTSQATLTVLVTDGPVHGQTWTNQTDFAVGSSFNVEQVGPNDLQIQDEAAAFSRLWVAVSSKGTVVKFDTDTNAIIGEYRIAPAGMPLNPSRTTVDLNGNVWATSRDGHSVVQIGLVENGQCEDRNGNGEIDTSTGFGDIRDWPNTGGVDSDGGVETAADECIKKYVLVSAWGTRHVAITPDNDVWVSGYGSTNQGVFDLIDGDTGAILRTEGPVGYGGYGGLIDPNGVIWSARSLLRWDTANPLTGPNGGNWQGYGHDSYGLCIDPFGNVWNTALGGNLIYKFAPDGTLIGTYAHGTYYAQGCAADRNGDIWVASSLYDTYVSRLKNDGTFVSNVPVQSGPTGVAVDANGYIWSTNYNAGTVSKIDPNAGPVGADGETPSGEVVFTSAFLGGYPYNYSDMTGSTLTGMPQSGTWTATYDSGELGSTWAAIAWDEITPCDSKISARVQTSDDGVTWSSWVPVENGEMLSVPPGQYLKVEATLIRCSTGENAKLRDLTVWTTSPLPPAATDNQTTTPEETPVEVTLEADTQPTPGGALTYEILKAPSYGEIGPIGADGTLTYTPDENYNGYDSIGFRVDDGELRSDPAFAVIEVTPINDPPVALDQTVDVDHNTAKEITLGATDVDGDDLAFVLGTPPEHGDVTGFPDGTVTYTPDDGYVGPDSFTFQADDDTGGSVVPRVLSNTATVTIDVGSTVPGPPIDVAGIGGNQNARVTWEPPLSDGGSPITGYEVRIQGTDTVLAVDPDPRVVIFGGLDNNTSYVFEARAENANGFGPWSEGSNEVKPRPNCDIDAFTDVTKDHPFCPEIKWMADNGVSFGFPDGTYRPLGNVTRGQMAGFIYRLAGSERGDNPVCTEEPVFSDLEIGDPFCGEIDWMVDEGISTGFDDGTYRPGATLTRAQMAAFLYRLTDSPRGDDPTCEADEFSDVPASHPFCGEIDWMVDSGITGGYPDGTFRPGNTILRQHMAAFIFRYNVLTGLIT